MNKETTANTARAKQEEIYADMLEVLTKDFSEITQADREAIATKLTRQYILGWNAAIAAVSDLRQRNYI